MSKPWITKKEIQMYLLVLGILLLIAIVITVVAQLGKREPKGVDIVHPFEDPYTTEPAFGSRPFVLNDLFFPKRKGNLKLREPELIRSPHFPWTPQEVEEAWIDPRDVGREMLEAESSQVWTEFIEDIP